MDGHDYLTELKNRAGGLKRLFNGPALSWFTSALLGEDKNGERIGPEKIYELLVFFTILREAERVAESIELVSSSTANRYRFASSPGLKGNFAFFRLGYHGEVFDLCFGTKLPDPKDPAQPMEAPDVSLQWMGPGRIATFSGNVSVGQAIQIWDAKYHEAEVFAKHDFQQIFTWCEILGLRPPQSRPPPSNLFPKELNRSSIITNAKTSPLNTRVANEAGLAVVFEFHGNLANVTIVPPHGGSSP